MEELFSFWFDPSKRLYWMYLLSSAVIAFLYLGWQRNAFKPLQQLAALFDRSFWQHSTHLVDLSLMALNSSFRVLLLVPLFGGHLLATIYVARLWQAGLGDALPSQMHWLMIASAYTFVFFLLEDLSRFCLHVCMHRFPLLWKMHRVHHSATLLTPLTLHRVHPIEMVIYYLRGLLVFGIVSGTFVYMYGRSLSGLDILGVDALGFLFNIVGANLRHSSIYIGFGRFERWFISPAQHQLHHSSSPMHYGRNYGTCLAVWDRVYKSWLPAAGNEIRAYGIPKGHGTLG